jgi:hypothetical protein
MPVAAALSGGLSLCSMDTFGQHFPDFLTSFRLWHWGPPLWNPLLQGGIPQVGYVESAALYPGLLLFRWFAPLTAYNLLISLHWLALGVGTYVWGRALRLTPLAALAAAFLVLRTNLTTDHIPYSNFLSFGWMPWAGLCLTMLDRTGRWRYAALGAVAIALPFYGGHPQYWITWLAGCLIYSGFLVFRSAPTERRRKAALFLSVWGIAALATLLQVLPTMAFLAEGPRAHMRDSRSTWVLDQHQGVGGFLMSLLVNFCDNSGKLLQPEDLHFLGLVPVLFAVRALRSRARELPVAAWAWTGALGLALVLGEYTGLPRLIQALPVLSLLHSVNRETLLFVYPAALLAGFGLDAPFPRAYRGRASVGAWVGAVAGLVAAAGLTVFLRDRLADALGAGGPHDAARAWTLVAALALALLAVNAALWLAAARVFPPREGRWVLALALAAGFWPQLSRPLTDVPVEDVLSLADAPPPSVRAVAELEKGARAPALTAAFSPAPLWPAATSEPWELTSARLISPNFSQAYGLAQVGLWHDAFVRTDFLDLGLTNNQGLMTSTELLSPRVQLLPMLGVRYVTARASDVARPEVRRFLDDRSAYSRLYADDSVVVSRRLDAFPRCWFVDAVRRAALPESRAAVLDALVGRPYDGKAVDFRKEAIADLPADAPAGAAGASRGTAAIASYEPSRVRLDVDAPAENSFLVCGDAFDAGWKAAVDGSVVPVYRTDLLMRGLFVPRGRHAVEFQYRPRSIGFGLAALALAAAALVAGGAFIPF